MLQIQAYRLHISDKVEKWAALRAAKSYNYRFPKLQVTHFSRGSLGGAPLAKTGVIDVCNTSNAILEHKPPGRCSRNSLRVAKSYVQSRHFHEYYNVSCSYNTVMHILRFSLPGRVYLIISKCSIYCIFPNTSLFWWNFTWVYLIIFKCIIYGIYLIIFKCSIYGIFQIHHFYPVAHFFDEILRWRWTPTPLIRNHRT